MKNIVAVFVSIFSVCAAASFAQAQALSTDIAFVTALSGEVRYQSKDETAKPAQAYMRIRHGDTIKVANGASIRLSYTTVPRQESWSGPATFVVTLAGGETLSGGAPVVAQLPTSVPQKLAKVAELMKTSHMGGLVVRSIKPTTPANLENVAAAMSVYESMRANTKATDVTPELFLYAVFLEYQMLDDLKIVAKEMRARQPDNAEIRLLTDAALLDR
jgi:hypothetical protein